ncbi:hypothetical protein M0805_008294 [Coniferiporia weirii]|nr:hypothetical protein M0805_008294 [Coniferiporia weirii]
MLEDTKSTSGASSPTTAGFVAKSSPEVGMSTLENSRPPSPSLADEYAEESESKDDIDLAAISIVYSNNPEPSKLPAPCKNFNESHCLCSTSCPYPHLCSLCGRSDHSALNCQQSADLGDARPARVKRGLVWDDDVSCSPCSQASLNAEPLPAPPSVNELPIDLVNTVRNHPELFKIVTPIDVDIFEALLKLHPNRKFVESVVEGLRRGFWPFAQIPYDMTVDESRKQKVREYGLRQEFLEEQLKKEVKAGRFSGPFGKRLYRGMACMPVHVGQSLAGKKFRLINNHSAGDHSLNSLIPENERCAQADDIRALIRILRARRLTKSNIVLFKSDVSHAFRIIPMSPYWQALQAVKVNGDYYVDRCNTFGNAASQRIFCAFTSLVLWIAENVWGIPDILSYVDDHFSWEYSSRKKYYVRYNKFLPEKQARLLELWDLLGIPHEPRKQESGITLTIIGYEVDLRRRRVSVPKEKTDSLITHLTSFCGPHPTSSLVYRSLQECQKLAGSANWTFEVNPLLRPGVYSLHKEMARASQEEHGKKCIISERIKADLSWLANLLRKSKGIPYAKSYGGSDSASCTIFTGASPTGFGFWSPTTNEAFHYRFAPDTSEPLLSACHMIAVICAIFWAKGRMSHSGHILIYTSDSTTAAVFDCFEAPDGIHELFLLAAEMLFEVDKDLCVASVTSEENTVAMRLSRDEERILGQDYPNLMLKEFKVPQSIIDRVPGLCESWRAVAEIGDTSCASKSVEHHHDKPSQHTLPGKKKDGLVKATRERRGPSRATIRLQAWRLSDISGDTDRTSASPEKEVKHVLDRSRFAYIVLFGIIVFLVIVEDLRALDFSALHKAGYRGAVFDKDNCLTIPYEDKLVPDLKEAWEECRSTFGDENILVADSVSYHLGVPVLRHNSMKPGYSCIRDIRAYFASLKRPVSDDELFIVGDRIFTDVVLANRMRSSGRRVSGNAVGPLSVFVENVWKKEAGIMRFLEKRLARTVERWTSPDGSLNTVQKGPFIR